MIQQNQLKTHELVTWKDRSWPLTEPEYRAMNERLEAGAKFLTLPDGSDSKVSTSDIKFFGRRQMSMSDAMHEFKALPAGEPKPFDPTGPGYIKFIAMKIKIALKHGVGLKKATEKLMDEQRPLLNAELEKQGIDFRV